MVDSVRNILSLSEFRLPSDGKRHVYNSLLLKSRVSQLGLLIYLLNFVFSAPGGYYYPSGGVTL